MIKKILLLFGLLAFGVSALYAQTRQTHSDEAGETLYSISRKLDVTVAELKAWNDLRDDNLSVGQTLLYYTRQEVPPSPQMDVTEGQPLINISRVQENEYYTVKSGDNLTTIARRHEMSLLELRELNNLSNDLLRIGQRLAVKKVKDSVAPSASEFTNQLYPQGAFLIYTVQSGESLQDILTRFKMTAFEIQELNPEINVRSLDNGQRITVLAPPSSNYENPYYNKANLQNLGTVNVRIYELEEAGNTTTNGELYDPQGFTAAHSNIALGSIIFIENQSNGRGIYVRINDRITQNGLKLSSSAYRILGLDNNPNPMVIIYTEG